MRILNSESLTSHGNLRGRQAIVKVLEAGLVAADPYPNTRQLIRVEDGKLIIGGLDFEPEGSPISGPEVYDLSEVGRIFVFGAGKGIQYVAKGIEDVLGDRLTAGHVILKHGDDPILERIGVTYGAHPVPDEACLAGCCRILEICRDAGFREDDLVFTIVGNGVSSLLTLPAPGVTLEDVRRITYACQIERGVPTGDLNAIRNHLDALKGGRIARHIQPARAIHLIAVDPSNYDQLIHRNLWLHTLPDSTTFEDAVRVLKRWDAWEVVPKSAQEYLLRADTRHETVKADEYTKMRFRIFGVMPRRLSMLEAAQGKARELGFRPYLLTPFLQAEASQAALVVASIATSIERDGAPFEPPCALISGGELLVTVGKETGIGGRNQEYVLSAAQRMDGSDNIVVGAVDSDGTDGPGSQFVERGDPIPVLAGGVVDGQTVSRAKMTGIDIDQALRRHNTTPALWRLDSGVLATHNISVNDLCVTLVLARGQGGCWRR